ncbi:MAG: LysR family transcriptional regulator [Lachnospiraceae bacterium]|nr:LysR family transcriptional regulator [Lachnospiraceae bacterium]
MDFHQLEYIIAIAEENNITRAAEKLFISQSALNQQLLKLEKELGCQLFHRSRTDWHLTEAGEIYVSAARRALLLKKDTYKRISDLNHSQNTALKIGLTPHRGFKMFTEIYPKLHEQYYNLFISPIEMSVQDQLAALKRGDIDLGFVTLTNDQKDSNEYLTIKNEEYIVAVPKIHPLCEKAAPEGEPLTEISINELEHEPFAMPYKISTSYPLCKKIFDDADISPMVLFETSSMPSMVSMVKLNLCCGILPRYHVDPNDPDYRCFSLKEHPSWEICIVYRRNSYVSESAQAFIELVKEYWTMH